MVQRPTTRFAPTGGLFAPEEMERLLYAELDRAERYEYPLSAVVISVDRLDSLQDMYGSESREEILQALDRFVRRTVRDSDLVGSLADDRMLVLLPHVPPDGARALCDRLQKGAGRLEFQAGRRRLRVTASIGLAHLVPEEAGPWHLLVDTAVDAAEDAASQGGNRWLERQPGVAEKPPAATFDDAALLDLVRSALGEHARAFESFQSARDVSSGQRLSRLETRLERLAHDLEAYQERLLSSGGGAAPARRHANPTKPTADPSKQAMLGKLFEANVALRQALARSRGQAERDPVNGPRPASSDAPSTHPEA
jgi:diguanylate cyclase (GGDEF)-like protein